MLSAPRVGVLSAASESDCPGLVDGGQGKGAGGSHYQPDPAVGLIPTCHEGSVAAGALIGRWGRSSGRGFPLQRGPGEFTACFRGRDPVRDFDEGLIVIAEEPVRVAELRDTQEPISEQISTA